MGRWTRAAFKRRVWQLRVEIYRMIGEACVRCGNDQVIEFDHIHGRDWDIKAVNQLTRTRRYLREARAGLLQPLCKPCNGWKSGGRRARRDPASSRPAGGASSARRPGRSRGRTSRR